MSEGIVIALIGFAGAVLGAAIAGFATVTAAGIKGKGESPISCGVVGLLASLGAAGGLVLGAVFGASVIQQRVATSQPPTIVASPTYVPTVSQRLEYINRFRVLANVPKNRTGLTVNVGDTVYVEYLDGYWTGEKGKQPPNTGCGFYFDDPYSSHTYPLDPKQNAGAALIAYIGELPLLVGCEPFSSTATISGELYLGMNDCQGCFWDNDGEIYVRISITRK